MFMYLSKLVYIRVNMKHCSAKYPWIKVTVCTVGSKSTKTFLKWFLFNHIFIRDFVS